MTTGRINQVTARAISPLQLGKGSREPAQSFLRFFDRRLGIGHPKARPSGEPWPALPRFIQYSSRTLHVPTGHVAPPRMVSHAPTDTANFRRAPLFPITLGTPTFGLPHLAARTCRERLLIIHGVCLRARARSYAVVHAGRPTECTTCTICHLDSNRPPPYSSFGE